MTQMEDIVGLREEESRPKNLLIRYKFVVSLDW